MTETGAMENIQGCLAGRGAAYFLCAHVTFQPNIFRQVVRFNSDIYVKLLDTGINSNLIMIVAESQHLCDGRILQYVMLLGRF